MPVMSPVARSPRSAPAVPDRAADGPGAVVSSPAIGAGGSGTHNRPAASSEGAGEGHDRVEVGPGIAGPRLRVGVGGYRMNPLEIQPAKIHCPPARDDTLSRERLNSWLERAASRRLGLILGGGGVATRRVT